MTRSRCALFLLAGTLSGSPFLADAGTQARTAQERPGTLVDLSRSFEELSEKIAPAVVQIFSTGYTPGRGLVPAAELLAQETSSGSGVILDPEGYVVTNAHVVRGARRVQVMLATPAQPTPGSSILRGPGKLVGAQIVGVDEETDLAVLKIEETGLASVPLGDSDRLRPGQLVLALGNPFGLDNSVSMGVVSSTARQLRAEDPMIYIQTDAPIHPGSSGGPLVNTLGEVVGINTLIVSQSGGSEGIGFAAPSNIVRFIYEQLRGAGRVRRGEIGVNAQTITPLLAKGLGLSRSWGVVLSDVYPGGPADEAGLRIGDVVVSLDGKWMENGRQFQVNLYDEPIGDSVTLEIEREGSIEKIAVRVRERRNSVERFADLVSPDHHLVPELGILGIDLDARIRAMFSGLRRTGGVLVAARSVDAPGFRGEGLLPGDVIHSVNRVSTSSLMELRAALAGLGPGDPAIVHVERQGQLLYVPMEIR